MPCHRTEIWLKIGGLGSVEVSRYGLLSQFIRPFIYFRLNFVSHIRSLTHPVEEKKSMGSLGKNNSVAIVRALLRACTSWKRAIEPKYAPRHRFGGISFSIFFHIFMWIFSLVDVHMHTAYKLGQITNLPTFSHSYSRFHQMFTQWLSSRVSFDYVNASNNGILSSSTTVKKFLLAFHARINTNRPLEYALAEVITSICCANEANAANKNRTEKNDARKLIKNEIKCKMCCSRCGCGLVRQECLCRRSWAERLARKR